ncbi:MAG: LysR family transcriptional regulator [Rhodospirillales bacterium]|nr:LysR family transcriptional regulator [Rhodospirillales bacterium]
MRLNPRTFNGKMSDGDIRLLRVFCAVTRCGGFAAAESELQLGLPSISRYIKDLETRLGVRLCRRGRVGFSLTDQGRQVYSSSLQLIADLERFEANIRSMHSDLTGTLNIGIIDTLITDKNLPIPEILKTYKKKHPYVEYDIITTTSNIIEQNVLDGTIHAGLVVGRRHINQLDYRFLYKEYCNMYCSEEHPLYDKQKISLEDISKYDYAGYSFMEDYDRFRSGGLLVKTASVDSMEAIATLISTGCFLGTLPDHYVQSLWRLKQFRLILPEVFGFSTDIELITRHGTSSPHVMALLDHLDGLQAKPRSMPANATNANPLGKVAYETGVV